MNIKMDKKLVKILEHPEKFRAMFEPAFFQTSSIVEANYKDESPIWKGDLVKYVDVEKTNTPIQMSYLVGSRAKNNGKPYPIYIHEGTGRFAGVFVDFPSPGRIRAGTTDPESGGIKPNKFAYRARKKSDPEIIERMNAVVRLIINKF